MDFFFGSDFADEFLANQTLTLTATDSLGGTSVQTISNATQTSFLGFISNGTLVSLSVNIGDPTAFATVDDLVLAQGLVAAIPEPETHVLMLLGLAAVSTVARRRHLRPPA